MLSGVISPLIWLRSIVALLILITLLITTHEPPSNAAIASLVAIR